ncbi:MAG: Calx-beta domain-containing protein [Kangiellaceae bacterium]
MPIFYKSHKLVMLLLFSILLLGVSSAASSFAVPDNVQAVFVNNGCLDCHSGANPSGQLSLDDAAISETSLVNIVANCSNANDVLVVEGDVDNSVLHQKLANANIACGGQMPPSGALISATDLAVIDNWIISIGPAQQFGLLTLEANELNVNEEQGEATLTVNRELGTQGNVSIDFLVSAVAGDSAENGTDFVELTGTVSFADGETSQLITFSLLDDDIFEGTEVFSIQLVAGTEIGGAVLGEPNLTKVNILDNELDDNSGTFLFSRVSYSAEENVEGGLINVTIIRSFGETGEVTVDYATSDSSAIAGSDYSATMGTLVFPEGNKSQTFTIAILDDDVEEENELFNLTLSQPGGGAELGAPSFVQVSIVDNDGNSDGGGDNGGGGDGGDTGGGDGNAGGGNSGNEGGVDVEATEDAEFEAAGSLTYIFLIVLVLLIASQKIVRCNEDDF